MIDTQVTLTWAGKYQNFLRVLGCIDLTPVFRRILGYYLCSKMNNDFKCTLNTFIPDCLHVAVHFPPSRSVRAETSHVACFEALVFRTLAFPFLLNSSLALDSLRFFFLSQLPRQPLMFVHPPF